MENVPHRQWVFTVPKILRKLFHKDRKLLSQMARCASETIMELYRALYQEAKPGIVLSIQTFGDLLLWHPHIHCLVTDGVFDKDNCFHPVPAIDTEKAVIIFREKIFNILRKNLRISEALISNMRNWKYTGFSVHNKVYISENNNKGILQLAEYILHSSFSSEKIRCSDKSENIIYRSKMHKGKNRNFEILNPIEFIHRICLHIPDRYESLIRYYGYYSNASRGKRKKESQKELKISDDTIDIRSARKTWAMLIHRVYEVDPLLCPKCGSEMKIIAFIQARSEIIKILRHLGLYPTRKPEPIKERASPYQRHLTNTL